MVVSNNLYVHTYLGKILILTSIFFRSVGSTTNQFTSSLLFMFLISDDPESGWTVPLTQLVEHAAEFAEGLNLGSTESQKTTTSKLVCVCIIWLYIYIYIYIRIYIMSFHMFFRCIF